MFFVPCQGRFVPPPVRFHDGLVQSVEQVLKPIVSGIRHYLEYSRSGMSSNQESRQLIDLRGLGQSANGQLLCSLVGIVGRCLGNFRLLAWPNNILCPAMLANRSDHPCAKCNAKCKVVSFHYDASLTSGPKRNIATNPGVFTTINSNHVTECLESHFESQY